MTALCAKVRSLLKTGVVQKYTLFIATDILAHFKRFTRLVTTLKETSSTHDVGLSVFTLHEIVKYRAAEEITTLCCEFFESRQGEPPQGEDVSAEASSSLHLDSLEGEPLQGEDVGGEGSNSLQGEDLFLQFLNSASFTLREKFPNAYDRAVTRLDVWIRNIWTRPGSTP